MRSRSMLLGAALAAAGLAEARAQVTVRLRSQYTRYLLFEPVVVRVRVENAAAEPLVFLGPEANAELTFDAESAPGEPVPRTAAPVLAAPFEVAAFGHGVAVVDLQPLFAVRTSGPLAVTARVKSRQAEFASSRLLLDIVPGLEIARLDAVTSAEPPGRRLFQLRTLGRDGREHLLLRVDDPERQVCRGVFDLGFAIRMWKPQMMLGRGDTFHVLHQSAPVRLTHSIYRDADRTVRSAFHGVTGAGARLERDAAGEVSVTGAGPYTGDPQVAPLRGDNIDRLPDRR